MRGLCFFILLGIVFCGNVAAAEDEFKAVIYWAKRGLADFQYKAAQMYEEGAHVKKDLQEANVWYKRSAENGYIPAIKKLASHSTAKPTGTKNKQGKPQPVQKTSPAPVKQAKVKPVPAPPRAKPVKNARKPFKTRKVTQRKELKKGKDAKDLTLETILAAHWTLNGSNPAPHMSSFITTCTNTSKNPECWSREHLIKSGDKMVEAKTKSFIKDFSGDGFTIRFRNMIIDAGNGRKHWEDKTHQLDCTIINRKKINCSDKTTNQKYSYSQVTDAQHSTRFDRSLLTSVKWAFEGQPASFLPSNITSCTLEEYSLVCWSKPRKLGLAADQSTVKTKSLIGKINDGSFTVKYRNLVMAAPGNSAWEPDTHKADCTVKSVDKIECIEDKRRMTYTKDIQKF